MLKSKNNTSKIILILVFLNIFTFLASAADVFVYSGRKEHLLLPVVKAYETESGNKIQYLTGKAGALLERLKAEGENTKADILITVDAGNLWRAKRAGVLRSFKTDNLEKNIPSFYRDPEGFWYGVSLRARTIVYHAGRVQPEELNSYKDLADSKWKGRLVLRTSKKVYNQSLVGMMMERYGEEETRNIVKGWVVNQAIPSTTNDTKAMKSLLSGQGDVCVVNTYYFGRLQKKQGKGLPLKIFWPDQKDGLGVHVNVSGVGLTKHGKNPEAAQHFLEWLSSPKAQKIFSSVNMEYPVNSSVELDPLVESWGDFKADKTPIEFAGKNQVKAIQIMDAAGYK